MQRINLKSEFLDFDITHLLKPAHVRQSSQQIINITFIFIEIIFIEIYVYKYE